MKRIVLLASLVGILAAAPLRAEFRQMNITAFGMDCATCAHAMTVSISKIPGVESVHVDINKGLVTVRLRPGNHVTLEETRKVILNDAFTPKNAQVVVVGELISQGGRLRFKVAGTNESFPVASTLHQSWQRQVDQTVTVNGLISTSGALQITRVSGESIAEK